MPLVDPSLAPLEGTVRQISMMVSPTTFTELPERISTGLYLCGHFNFQAHMPIPFDPYPSLHPAELSCYGVCDDPLSWYQDHRLALEALSNRNFVVAFVRVARKDQPEQDGWRWSKWGHYIGRHTPQHEYLYDETDIDTVYVFHIYEVTE